MACERRLQAKHRMGDALGDLDQVEVGRWRVGPPIDAAAQRQDRSGIAQSVDAGIAQTRLSGLAVAERIVEQLAWVGRLHRGDYTHRLATWVGLSRRPSSNARGGGKGSTTTAQCCHCARSLS